MPLVVDTASVKLCSSRKTQALHFPSSYSSLGTPLLIHCLKNAVVALTNVANFQIKRSKVKVTGRQKPQKTGVMFTYRRQIKRRRYRNRLQAANC